MFWIFCLYKKLFYYGKLFIHILILTIIINPPSTFEGLRVHINQRIYYEPPRIIMTDQTNGVLHYSQFIITLKNTLGLRSPRTYTHTEPYLDFFSQREIFQYNPWDF
jgi:hypothetical protein